MDCILFILAIIYAVKRPRLSTLRAARFPDVPLRQFQEWRRLELLSRDIVIWLGFGWVGLEVIAAVVLGRKAVVLVVVAIPVLLVVLVISAIIGSKAQKIKKQYKIKY